MVEVTENDWTSDEPGRLDVGIFDLCRLVKLVIPYRLKKLEDLIITSGYGRFSSPFFAIHNASKFVLEGLS